jgi:2-(1,2-epoxy-1,2-dihydrophenyl)acetyl-CoA isomerase
MTNDTTHPEPPVRLLREGGVAILELNRPEARNALDVALTRAFHEACRTLAADTSVRAVLLRGRGRGFGVGGDLSQMHGDGAGVARQLIEHLHGGLRLLAAMDAPVVGAVHGAVAGGSMSLALGCDLLVAADDAQFNLAYARIGASNDGSSSWHLPRLVGLRRAMEIALLCETIDAPRALDLGLVNRVVPAAELATVSMQLATQLASGPTKAHGRIKRLLRRSLETDLDTQLDAERDAFIEGTATEDFREGLAAFLGKRPPKFIGR